MPFGTDTLDGSGGALPPGGPSLHSGSGGYADPYGGATGGESMTNTRPGEGGREH